MMLNNQQQEQIRQIMKDPKGAALKAGYQIPDDVAGDPKQMVMHILNSGQVPNPLMQKVVPMLLQLLVK